MSSLFDYFAGLMAQPLQTFFVSSFVPRWLHAAPEAVRFEYQQSVDRYLLFAGVEPTVAEITDEKLKAFSKWLVHTERCNTRPAKDCAARVRQIRQFAYLGTGPTRDMLVRDFIKHVYVKEREIKSDTLWNYRLYVKRLSRFYGSDILVSELRHELLESWRSHLLTKMPEKKVTRFYQGVRSVWNLAYRLGYSFVPPDGIPDPVKLPTESGGDTLRMLCASRYFNANLRIRSPQTKKQYFYALRDMAAAIGHEPTLADLTDDNIAATMKRLVDIGRAERTANQTRDRLHALWSWLAKRGYVKEWPTTPAIPEPERTPVAWTREQLAVVFAVLDNVHGTIDYIPARLWWKSLHLVMWDTGERIGALIQCRWAHISGEWLTIPAELRKGKRKSRAYRLAPDTLSALREIQLPVRDLIWPWPFNRMYLWGRYRNIRKRAGLPLDRYSSFHRMRRSVASHAEAAGGNATELLDHSARRVTKLYLDPTITKPPQATDVLFRPTSMEGTS